MCKILIVDNHPKWLDFSKEVLESHGYEVVTALTVDSLQVLLDRNNHDLILINAAFMFGEFQEPIRRLFAKNADRKPIIVVSVPSSRDRALEETRTAFKMGAKDFVEKPFGNKQLLTLIKHLLDEFVGDKAKRQGVIP